MFNILSSSINRVLDLLGRLGYPGVFLFSLLDRLTVFLIPGEIILPAFGILIDRGNLNFWPVFIWVTIGAFLGNLILYFIFLKGGRPFLERYGRYFFISKHELEHLDSWFSKYGDRIVLIGYLLPTSIRSLVPIPAGISRMNLGKFSFYTFIGSIPYNLLLIFIGIKAGERFNEVLSYFEKFNYIVISAIALLIIWYVIRHRKGKHLLHGNE